MGGPGSGSWYRWDRRTILDAPDYVAVRVLAHSEVASNGERYTAPPPDFTALQIAIN